MPSEAFSRDLRNLFCHGCTGGKSFETQTSCLSLIIQIDEIGSDCTLAISPAIQLLCLVGRIDKRKKQWSMDTTQARMGSRPLLAGRAKRQWGPTIYGWATPEWPLGGDWPLLVESWPWVNMDRFHQAVRHFALSTIIKKKNIFINSCAAPI